MQITQALIMAAGRGTRMYPLTDVVPKPMAPYKGSTLIAQRIERIAQHVGQIHITVGYKKAMLAQHVIEHGVASVLNTEGHDNAWWVYNTLLRYVNEPIFVLTCDNVTELDFGLLAENYVSAGAPPCMLVPVTPIEGLAGDYIRHEGGVVTNLDRHRPSDIYCSGIQVLNPSLVRKETDACENFYDLWRQLIQKKMLRVSSVYPKNWFSVDTMEQLVAAEARDL